jgi:hypothetical protein
VAEETEVLRASRPRRVSTAANRGGAPARREGTCSASALWRKDPPCSASVSLRGPRRWHPAAPEQI